MSDRERELRDRIAEYRVTVSRLEQARMVDASVRETMSLDGLRRVRGDALLEASARMVGWLDRTFDQEPPSDDEWIRVLRLYEDTDDALAQRPARRRDGE